MKKNKIIILISVIIIVIIGVWLIFVNQDQLFILNSDPNEPQNPDSKEEPANNETQINVNATSTEDMNTNYHIALDSQSVDNCFLLNDNFHKNSCVKQIAMQTENVNLCSEIKESEKIQDCKDATHRKIAIDNNNVNNCSLIESSFMRSSCLNSLITANDYNSSTCDEIQNFEDSNSCKQTVAFNNAVESQDCSTIEDEQMRQECESSLDNKNNTNGSEEQTEEELKNMDSDNDGLSDYEEINVYDTDPENEDTDGDGYLDGEEVEAGYDPLS